MNESRASHDLPIAYAIELVFTKQLTRKSASLLFRLLSDYMPRCARHVIVVGTDMSP